MSVRPVQWEVTTPSGPALLQLDRTAGDTLLILGHGAGGSVDAPDLAAVRARCLEAGISVARVTQPYRLAGKKAPPPAAALDAAWVAVVRALIARRGLSGHRLVFGGRSAGARVACRTSVGVGLPRGPSAVVALAFPMHPPGKPEKSRAAELDAVPVPVLVVQGDRDPFGMPGKAPGRRLAVVAGDHSLKRASSEVAGHVAEWLSARPWDRTDT